VALNHLTVPVAMVSELLQRTDSASLLW
jgi:hypothetical protein